MPWYAVTPAQKRGADSLGSTVEVSVYWTLTRRFVESLTIRGQYHCVPRIDYSILGEIAILTEALHLRLPCLAPSVMYFFARVALETALHWANKPDWVSLLEFASSLARASRYYVT